MRANSRTKFLNKNFINIYRQLIGSSIVFSIIPLWLSQRREKILALMSQRMGIIKSWFNGDGGYGFIYPDDGGEAVFVHHTAIAPYSKVKSLNKGVRVTYEVAQRSLGGLWAKDVCTTD